MSNGRERLRRYARRIRQELDCPTKAPFRMLRHVGLRTYPKPRTAQRLDFVYDLGCNATSFDFSYRLLMAEEQRRARGLEYTRLIIVKPSFGTPYLSESDYARHVSQQDIERRIHHILIQLAGLCGAIREVVLCHRDNLGRLFDRESSVFPNGYIPQSPVPCPTLIECRGLLPSFDIPPQNLALVSEYLATLPNKVVTITLRNYGYLPVRNSNMQGWRGFAEAVSRAGYTVLILPDLLDRDMATSTTAWGFDIPAFCSFDLINRAALYRLTFMNLGVGSGPIMLSFLDHTSRCLMFHRLPANDPAYTASILRSQGDLRTGVPYVPSSTSVVHDEDTSDNILREFNHAIERVR